MKTNLEIEKFRELLSKGLALSFQKLLKEKQLRNGFFIFSENGKNVKVAAKDVK